MSLKQCSEKGGETVVRLIVPVVTVGPSRYVEGSVTLRCNRRKCRGEAGLAVGSRGTWTRGGTPGASQEGLN